MAISRRGFLHHGALGLGALAASSSLARWVRTAGGVSAARYAGYRAGVCVFLLGGNDGNQLAVPLDPAAYGVYKRKRPTLALALPGDTSQPGNPPMLPIAPANVPERYGLHPALPELQRAFTAGTAALVWNVGPLVVPTSLADFRTASHPRPYDLRSHSSQQDAWSSAIPIPGDVDPSLARTGWGGRLGDRLTPLNAALSTGDPYPAVTMLGGRRLFAAGTNLPLATSIRGGLSFSNANNDQLPGSYFRARRAATLDIAQITTAGPVDAPFDVALEQAYGGVYTTAIAAADAHKAARDRVWSALPPATTAEITNGFKRTDKPHWTLTTQLESVLRDIAGAAHPSSLGLGLKRQLFSVGIGGFDTHDGQREAQDDLFQQLDFALAAFTRGLALLVATGQFGATPPEATLFTMSDFGRTLQENANGGTDHAWGNHMIVLGTRVIGKRVYGTYPTLTADLPDSVDSAGRWIPTLTVDQYARGIASWLGASATELDEIFPNHPRYVAAAGTRTLPPQFTWDRVPFMRAQ